MRHRLDIVRSTGAFMHNEVGLDKNLEITRMLSTLPSGPCIGESMTHTYSSGLRGN